MPQKHQCRVHEKAPTAIGWRFYLNIKTTCDITLKYLDKIGFKYGKIDLEYLSKLITYLKDIKFI